MSKIITHGWQAPCGAKPNESNLITEDESEITCKVCLLLDYLVWFRSNADFGPADDDVIYYMHQRYERSGKKVPKGWGRED